MHVQLVMCCPQRVRQYVYSVHCQKYVDTPVYSLRYIFGLGLFFMLGLLECFQLCVNSVCLSLSYFNMIMPTCTKPAP